VFTLSLHPIWMACWLYCEVSGRLWGADRRLRSVEDVMLGGRDKGRVGGEGRWQA
jgi:hypothetical protein